jgi:DNA repair protein RecO (recombination protein O)
VVKSQAEGLDAYVLHRWDWSESSAIVDLFTRERGRLAVAAKGAKRPTSQLRAVLRPFQRIHVTLGRDHATKPQDIHALRSAEWGGGAVVAGGDALFAGFYCNELVMKLLARDDPHPALWDAFALTLPQLGGSDEAAALRAFELLLLREVGLLPDLSRVTATLAQVQPDLHYGLNGATGVVQGPAGVGDAVEAGLRGDDLRALQAALDANDASGLLDACRASLQVLRRHLRQLIDYHLDGQTLATRDVLIDLQPLLAR